MKKLNKGYKPEVSFFGFLKPFAGFIILITLFGISANGLSLLPPKLAGNLIDKLNSNELSNIDNALLLLILLSLIIFVINILQIVISAFVSELVAQKLRKNILKKISEQNITFVNEVTPSKLLTIMTSDVDSVKVFISQGLPVLISSIILAVGATIALFLTNAKLALLVLIPLPLIIFTFMVIFSMLIKLFKKSQEIIDRLNFKISETIFGAILIRVLNSQNTETSKFSKIAIESKMITTKILKLFSLLLPTINIIFNLMLVSIVYFGGLEVIEKNLSIGEFQAFYQYSALLITPIFVLGFVSSIISRSISSYNRIAEVLESNILNSNISTKKTVKINGNIKFTNVYYEQDEKILINNFNFEIKSKTKVAIVGPTAAGKTLLINLMLGFYKPTSGKIFYEGIELSEINISSIYQDVSVVFQENIIFNSTIRENITLGDKFSDEEILHSVKLSALDDLIENSNDLDKLVAEKGTTLSGGQKQRLMLARAIIRKPKVLILDDFTSRVDIVTEQKIYKNIFENFDGITLISVTQKIEPIKNFDQIFLIMEGELIGVGRHEYLLENCFEYKQIYESQKSLI